MKSKKEARARGAALHALRVGLKLSLVELAGLSRVSFSMLSLAERGKRNLSKKAQARIEQACASEVDRRVRQKQLQGKLDAAELEVARCHVAMYRKGLPEALKKLDAVMEEAKEVFSEEAREALKHRNVIGLLKDYERQIEQMRLDAESWMQTVLQVAVFWHEAIAAQQRGTPFPGHENALELHEEAKRQLDENGKIPVPESLAETIQGIKEILMEGSTV